MARRKKIYEGKAKILYEGPEAGTIVQYFKDDATAFNGEKKATIAGKGVLNNRISAHLLAHVEAAGVPTHFLRAINMREQLVRAAEIIPVEVVIRNVAAGSLCKRLGLKEGMQLPYPLLEYYYKSDALGDPMVSESHIFCFGWADGYEVDEMASMAWRVNDRLAGLFAGVGLRLVDMKLEFGRIWGENGELYIVLADEISPDTCRIWDAATGEKLDKDRFRYDLGDLIEGYQKVGQRLGLVPEGGLMRGGDIAEQLAAGLEQIEAANDGRGVRPLRAVPKPPGRPPHKA
jgi:phosphoribosylaminoimidazole-succinocarboxamide synthase